MFNKILINLRKNKGLNQTQLGEILGYSQDTISMLERGKMLPDYYTIKKLCIIFNISADELLEIDTDKQKQTFINSFNGNFKNTNINF